MNITPSLQRGTTLVVGLILLSMVTLLGLAGASTARVERLLAQNEMFRENAASAASAGIESVISQIVTTTDPAAVAERFSAPMPGTTDRYETVTRFAGLDAALPQPEDASLAGAHFEISSTGFSGRAVVHEHAEVMLVLARPAVTALDCEPVVRARCYAPGELVRLAWHRIPVE